MESPSLLIDRGLVAFQFAIALLAPAALVLSPPPTGTMLLVPIGDAPVAGYARAHGALLLGPGPFAGSLVVSGARASLAGNPLRTGIVVLAGSRTACGLGEKP